MGEHIQTLPSHRDDIAPWRQELSRRVVNAVNGLADWLLDHWLDTINWFLGTLLGLALLTPVLAYFGVEPLAGFLFRSFHSICEQVPSHALFIFGHQIALCSRNFSLYGSIWLGSMLFRFFKGRVKPLPWYLLVLFLLPMALDGGTQLFGLRESTLFLRVVTGTLFGLGGCWFLLPFIQQAVDESRPETMTMYTQPTAQRP